MVGLKSMLGSGRRGREEGSSRHSWVGLVGELIVAMGESEKVREKLPELWLPSEFTDEITKAWRG